MFRHALKWAVQERGGNGEVEDGERCKGIDQRCNTVMCDGSALIDF